MLPAVRDVVLHVMSTMVWRFKCNGVRKGSTPQGALIARQHPVTGCSEDTSSVEHMCACMKHAIAQHMLTHTTHYCAETPADERFDFLISVISMIGIISCFSILHLFIVFIVHHVLEQHRDEAPHEGPQHCWLHLSLTECCPDFA